MNAAVSRSLALLATVAALTALVWSRNRPPADTDFHGKPESACVTNLAYNDEAQVQQWRAFGPDAIAVLTRGLDRASPVMPRAYRTFFRSTGRWLPGPVHRRLPPPSIDATRSLRMRIASLLSHLDDPAATAMPSMVRLLDDEDDAVRAIAIGYFTGNEDATCLISRMQPEERADLLPIFLRLAQEPNNGVRNNSLVALRFFADYAAKVVPTFSSALRDPVPRHRIRAAEGLLAMDAAAEVTAEAVPVLIQALRDPNDQIAYRAAELLGLIALEPSRSVPALMDAARSTNALVATRALRALGHFPASANIIDPFLAAVAAQGDRDRRAAAEQGRKELRSGTAPPSTSVPIPVP